MAKWLFLVAPENREDVDLIRRTTASPTQNRALPSHRSSPPSARRETAPLKRRVVQQNRTRCCRSSFGEDVRGLRFRAPKRTLRIAPYKDESARTCAGRAA